MSITLMPLPFSKRVVQSRVSYLVRRLVLSQGRSLTVPLVLFKVERRLDFVR
jgi:hypothetical protein